MKKETKDILEEFDKIFVNKDEAHFGDGDKWLGEEGSEYWDTLIDADEEGKVEEIKSFIKWAIQQERERIKKETIKLFEALKKEAEISKEPVFLYEMENQLNHLKGKLK